MPSSKDSSGIIPTSDVGSPSSGLSLVNWREQVRSLIIAKQNFDKRRLQSFNLSIAHKIRGNIPPFNDPNNTFSTTKIDYWDSGNRDHFKIEFRAHNSQYLPQTHSVTTSVARNTVAFSFNEGQTEQSARSASGAIATSAANESRRGTLKITTQKILTDLLTQKASDLGNECQAISDIPRTVNKAVSSLRAFVKTTYEAYGAFMDPVVDYGTADWTCEEFPDKTRYSLKGRIFDGSGQAMEPGVVLRFDFLKNSATE